MQHYAEDAYGKFGFFLTSFLYFLSLAIANLAIAISALGYIAEFFPYLSSSPAITCIGTISLLWLTTVANFGGPKWTGRIGLATARGVKDAVLGGMLVMTMSFTIWGFIAPRLELRTELAEEKLRQRPLRESACLAKERLTR